MAKGEVCKTFIQRFDSARRLHSSRSLFLFTIGAVVLALAMQPQTLLAMEASTKTGTLVAVDAQTRQIIVREGQTEARYAVPDGAIVMQGRRPCSLDSFAVGASVVVRFRVGTAEPHTVYDMADAATWAWLTRVRRTITAGRVVEVSDAAITIEDKQEHGQMRYRVTDKTRIEIAGATASWAAVKPEMSVFVAPRLLPSGQTMATAIADTRAAAERLRERSMPTVSGTVRALDEKKRALQMETRAGDRRSLSIADPCIIRRDGKDVAMSQVRPGVWITAHVRKRDGREVVYRITIARRPSAGTKAKP